MSITIGELLQKKRLERNLSLQEVVQRTHIRLHYLEALEKDQRHLLPSLVQGKGFLRLYADLLDLPVQPLLEAWAGKQVDLDQMLNHGIPAEEPPETSEELTGDESASGDEGPVLSSSPTVSEEKPVVLTRTRQFEDTPPVVEIPLHTQQSTDESPVIQVDPVEEPEPELPPTSPEYILLDIGRQLRSRRVSINLKLSDAERFTHIRQKYIEALEKGRIEELPSPVHARGLLNNYAEFLELDSEAILLRFADALQSRRSERSAIVKAQSRPAKRRKPANTAPGWRRWVTPDLLIGAVVILALFGFGVWSAAQVSAMRRAEAAATQPAVASNLIADDETTPTPGSETPLPQPSFTSIGAVAIEANNEVEGSAEEQAAEEEDPANPNLTGTIEPLGNAPLQLYIVAKQRAWLRVVADNKEVFNGRVVPGNAYQFSGDNQLDLISGNAAGLQVIYNQIDLGYLGGTGQTVTLSFNQQGVTTPTSSVSATPSPTQLSTLTLAPTPTSPTPTITLFVP
jgi:cytoskeletal protein RodZ